MWEWIRYRALILAAVPFVLAGSLWLLFENAGGWDKLGFLFILIVAMALLESSSLFGSRAPVPRS